MFIRGPQRLAQANPYAVPTLCRLRMLAASGLLAGLIQAPHPGSRPVARRTGRPTTPPFLAAISCSGGCVGLTLQKRKEISNSAGTESNYRCSARFFDRTTPSLMLAARAGLLSVFHRYRPPGR